MTKNAIIITLLVAVLALGWYALWPRLSHAPASPATTTPDVVCAQVITPARNPDTGEIIEFPTPCDVPDGWEVIQNDILDLNLEVQ